MSAKYFREIQISTKILGKHLNCWPFGPQEIVMAIRVVVNSAEEKGLI